MSIESTSTCNVCGARHGMAKKCDTCGKIVIYEQAEGWYRLALDHKYLEYPFRHRDYCSEDCVQLGFEEAIDKVVARKNKNGS